MVSEMPSQQQDIVLDIIRDPNQFTVNFYDVYRRVKALLLDNLTAVEKINIYDFVSEAEKARILREIEALFEDLGYGSHAGGCVHRAVYLPFARSRGFTEQTQYGEAALLISRLDEQQVAEWEKYLASVEFIQNKRMLVAEGVSMIPFPLIGTKYCPQNIALAADLEQVKRELTLKLLPNIRDEEAQKALGLRYTADIVRSTVFPSWFAGS